MFEGFWYFWNKDGLLPNEQIKEDKFDKILRKLGTKFKSKFLAIVPVAPYYIVVVSYPDHITADELELELPIVLARYVAMFQQSAQAETRGDNVANGQISCEQKSLAGFGAVPHL